MYEVLKVESPTTFGKDSLLKIPIELSVSKANPSALLGASPYDLRPHQPGFTFWHLGTLDFEDELPKSSG